jgi:hypothetical protein
MSWSRSFDQRIPLPGGGEISTLREAGDYIIALPEREHSQTAMRCLIEAAEQDGIVAAQCAAKFFIDRRESCHADVGT